MAKASGRLCVIKKNSTTIAGGRTVGVTVNGAPIDVQDQGDSGYVTHLAGILNGQSLDLTIDGYEEDQVLRDIAMGAASGKFLTDITFDYPNGDAISGSFTMTGYTETGAYDDGQTFNATFQSDGAWIYTPAV